MFARVVGKLIVALSVALAVALMLLWLRTRRSDLVVSAARNGTYREIRLAGGRVAVTAIPKWPADERVRWGRPAAVVDRNVRIQTAGTVPAQTRAMTLLDGTEITLQTTAKAAWLHWPPAKSAGTAYFYGSLPKKHLRAATMPFIGSAVMTLPATQPIVIIAPVGPTPTTQLSTGSLTLIMPSTMPTVSSSAVTLRGNGPATSTANAVLAAVRAASGVTFSTAPPGGGKISAGNGTLRITGGTVYILPAYTFERYAAPVWTVVAVVLLPVWCALALATARAARRYSRRRRGLCESCGYDLRGSPAGGACPECGTDSMIDPAPLSGEALLARLR